MREFNLESESANKIYLLFKHLDSKNIKEISIVDLQSEIGAYFGLSHVTIFNYKKSFVNMGFLISKPSNHLQTFKIDYSKVESYLEKVREIEATTNN